MANPKYPLWVTQLSERRLAETFRSDTLARGQSYADQGRVGQVAVGSGTGGSTPGSFNGSVGSGGSIAGVSSIPYPASRNTRDAP